MRGIFSACLLLLLAGCGMADVIRQSQAHRADAAALEQTLRLGKHDGRKA
jgi:hypothetical protein